jgi:hypothetical protein
MLSMLREARGVVSLGLSAPAVAGNGSLFANRKSLIPASTEPVNFTQNWPKSPC